MSDKEKFVIIVPDGMADNPISALGGRTPMQAADKPMMDYLARNGLCGYVQNIPEGMESESDTANMSILGFDPAVYSKGRSPLEALSRGLEMRENDIAIRCNLVTLSENEPYEEKFIFDHSADEITTEESKVLVETLDAELGNEAVRFHTGVSYRQCLLWENSPGIYKFTPPHNILNKKIKEYLPNGKYLDLMKQSYDILNNHEINNARRARNLKPANSIWLWSPGTKPALPDFYNKYGLKGSVVCAVDLLKGIAMCAGMKVVNVIEATGNFHTNYSGKAEKGIEELKNGADFVFIHIEAPDECGHRGELENKIKSIEIIDDKIVRQIFGFLKSGGYDFKMLILPDHPTPVEVRTHTKTPVPFLFYNSRERKDSGVECFSESEVKNKSNVYFPDGYKMFDYLLSL